MAENQTLYKYQSPSSGADGYTGWCYGDYNATYNLQNMFAKDSKLTTHPDKVYLPATIKAGTLIAYWCNYWSWYEITCALTDGHNVSVGKTITRTRFPYARLYDSSTGKYHKVMPMIYTGTKYELAPAFVYDAQASINGEHYKESYGEELEP